MQKYKFMKIPDTTVDNWDLNVEQKPLCKSVFLVWNN